MQDDALLGANDNCMGMRHRVGDRHKLDLKWTDRHAITIVRRHEINSAEKTGFFNAVTCQAEGEPRPKHWQRSIPAITDSVFVTQKELNTANVIFVAVGCDKTNYR